MLKKYVLFLLLAVTIGFMPVSSNAGTVSTTPIRTATSAAPTVAYLDVLPMNVVQNPQKYLGKNIRIKAVFDKFSIVGLDYKPAYRSSEDYILFLIRKSENKDHVIPLSEMKLFITRKKAEKFIDLEAGDDIEFTGKVFSAALGDPWIDVNDLKILKSKKDKDKEVKTTK